ncbi:hypothetical protein PHYSODRAFT_343300 [Phytophthora sojae]|uniref:Uncharacterized protein n=1 Tax=Phytophthora sojae (strain P6497) TaxID=1094619 RepID=G5AJA2_PHYSP|nr:hypothetical protein PHYSODRAFT_343300 [Phytophthora sojae]EGZ04395.1 hypothetical protein PHYSODRAFT_343300 [Phytophthora sojae]|eukprot:XP_009540153.1 hypothetical protein PHYSODRAFT_343300 [Phytophthora sojae]
MGRSRELSSLVCFPAAKGNNKAMQYLLDEGAGGPFEQAMLNPASFTPLALAKNKFEVLLFLHEHHPEAFTPDFVRSARLPITGLLTPSDVQIQNWLKLHYPVSDISQLAGGLPERVAQQIARQQAKT